MWNLLASLFVTVPCDSDILAMLSPAVPGVKGGAMLRSNAMTIGQLSQRTGVPINVLRHYEDLGFLYTLGRSKSNYRLFG
jgi:MerR family regulatory protein